MTPQDRQESETTQRRLARLERDLRTFWMHLFGEQKQGGSSNLVTVDLLTDGGSSGDGVVLTDFTYTDVTADHVTPLFDNKKPSHQRYAVRTQSAIIGIYDPNRLDPDGNAGALVWTDEMPYFGSGCTVSGGGG